MVGTWVIKPVAKSVFIKRVYGHVNYHLIRKKVEVLIHL